MQYTVNITTPLAANGVLTDIRQVDPDFPYLEVSIQTDQGGILYLTETEQVQGTDPTAYVQAFAIAAGANLSMRFLLRQAYYAIKYTNGPVAQTSFQFTYGSSYQATESEDRLQALILRELRAISMLIANLKEPTGTQVNIPYGFDQVTPQ